MGSEIFETLELIQDISVPKEKIFHNTALLNKQFKNSVTDNILYINIRSLNANFEKLLVFLKSLEIKPNIIVCSESWELKLPKMYQIKGYKMYYNNSSINRADGVVTYIKDEILENT